MRSNTNCTVGEARRPILSSFFDTRNPGRSGVRMNAEMPFDLRRASGVSVRTIAMITPACVPLVTQAFAPSRIQSSPSRVACARMAEASEPASGSERANAPSSSPRASGLRKRCFCSSLAKFLSICVGSELCTDIITATDASALAISSSANR